MSDTLQLILEDTDGTQLETSCTRVAVMWQGKELWIQQDGRGQLLIGVDVEEGDAEYANLLLRPLATNLVSLNWKWNRLKSVTKTTCTARIAHTTTKETALCSPSANCLN